LQDFRHNCSKNDQIASSVVYIPYFTIIEFIGYIGWIKAGLPDFSWCNLPKH
jgi:hypothetical protein